MVRRGVLARVLGKRWCRGVAALGAYLLALQAAGLPLLTAETPSACCCSHRSEGQRCNCKICSHAREVASNVPVLKTCGPAGEPALSAALEPFKPPPAP